MEKVYKTTLTEFKAVLHNWFAGTGGKSGDSSMFEDWGDEKLNKYDVDIEAYDHTNMKERPSILIYSYSKKRST